MNWSGIFLRISKLTRIFALDFKTTATMNKQSLYKIIVTIATALVTCAAIALGLTSCNVTRTVTTQSQYFQHGDTTCTIVTKTVESYDATKKLH